ncbi:D-3-phosphoglycerate dehydrogenase [Klebsiella pneumoniae]|uniref:D-3-phosphoglycerate dehydrogenase n=1 Tax=Klebsiella pneumoniae TaxID=573 RepID=A0A4P0XPI1_KLEPN|nr:D-3-phosphoglycerate dehydrogenase [Klebsiella pneumoniae]
MPCVTNTGVKTVRTIRRSRSLAEKSWGWLASVILPNWSRDFSAALARRLSFTDKYVAGHERYEKVDSLDELVQRADVISLHARLTPETENLINAHHFALMKRSAIIVNTARSGLINEKEMIDALRSGQIMGAALDTFDDEPLPDDSAFYTLNNVTITPHIAGSTIDAFSNSPKLFAEILLKKLS